MFFFNVALQLNGSQLAKKGEKTKVKFEFKITVHYGKGQWLRAKCTDLWHLKISGDLVQNSIAMLLLFYDFFKASSKIGKVLCSDLASMPRFSKILH